MKTNTLIVLAAIGITAGTAVNARAGWSFNISIGAPAPCHAPVIVVPASVCPPPVIRHVPIHARGPAYVVVPAHTYGLNRYSSGYKHARVHGWQPKPMGQWQNVRQGNHKDNGVHPRQPARDRRDRSRR